MIEQKDIDMDKLNATIIDYRDQVQRLRECAERLQYETDAIPAIKAERDEYREKYNSTFTALDDCARLNIEVAAERDAYAAAADSMAMSHKVERDALRDAARFALDALEYHTAQTRPIERTQIAIEILKAVL